LTPVSEAQARIAGDGFQQPASPTIIDQEIQDMGWALLPDLSQDLNNFKNQSVSSEAAGCRSAFKNSMSDPLPQGFQSSVQDPKGGTVNGSFLLNSRIPASQKGKQLQEAEGIHVGLSSASFPAHQSTSSATPEKTPSSHPESSSARQSQHQMTVVIIEQGWEPARSSHTHRRPDTERKLIQHNNLPADKATGSEIFKKKMGEDVLIAFPQTT
jgi:hypothetical protein